MNKRYRSTVLAVLILLFAVSLTTASQAQGNGPQFVPPTDKFHGLSYGEWEAKWWQAAFAIPIVGGDHPLFSGGAFGDEKGVVFLSRAGSSISLPHQMRTCSVFSSHLEGRDQELGHPVDGVLKTNVRR